jgi:glycerol kinase
MAYSTLDVAKAMEADSGVDLAELRVDGGAAANDWLMQFQADILAAPVHRPAVIETTAYGAAGLAGLACGFWKSPEEFLSARGEETVFQPRMAAADRAVQIKGWKRALATARNWAEMETE